MTDSNGLSSMFEPETHYSVRVNKEVNGYPILTGYIFRADAAGIWLDWHVNNVVRKVYVPFTNITHIEGREY